MLPSLRPYSPVREVAGDEQGRPEHKTLPHCQGVSSRSARNEQGSDEGYVPYFVWEALLSHIVILICMLPQSSSMSSASQYRHERWLGSALFSCRAVEAGRYDGCSGRLLTHVNSQCDFDIAGSYDTMIPDAEIFRIVSVPARVYVGWCGVQRREAFPERNTTPSPATGRVAKPETDQGSFRRAWLAGQVHDQDESPQDSGFVYRPFGHHAQLFTSR